MSPIMQTILLGNWHYLKNVKCTQPLLNPSLDGILSHAQNSLKSARSSLSHNNLEAHNTNLLVVASTTKGEKACNKYKYIHTCNSTQQSRHHMLSSTALVKLLKYAFFHVQKTPLQTPDKASALNLIHSNIFLPAIKFEAGKWLYSLHEFGKNINNKKSY
jgi:hypothetical protein